MEVTGTGKVLIANVPFVEPANTIKEVGTIAEAKLLLTVITRPFVGAEPVKVTVPVDPTPLTTLVGLRERLWIPGGLTVSGTPIEEPP